MRSPGACFAALCILDLLAVVVADCDDGVPSLRLFPGTRVWNAALHIAGIERRQLPITEHRGYSGQQVPFDVVQDRAAMDTRFQGGMAEVPQRFLVVRAKFTG